MESPRNIPLVISEKILEYVPSKDRKNCRLVCYNWCYLIDLYLGFKMKLTRANKASVFYSDLLRCCKSLKICKNAGIVNWYFCPFWKTLQTIEIHGIIVVENWVLLLSSCENLEFVTVSALKKGSGIFATGAIKDIRNPKVARPGTVNSGSLRRIRFIEEDDQMDFLHIARVLNTIGIVPYLRQVLICKNSLLLDSAMEVPQFETATTSLMTRNPSNTINFSLSLRISSSSNIDMWDRILKDGKNCLVMQQSLDTHYYPQIYNGILGPNLETLYFSLSDWGDDFVRTLNIIRLQCWNLKKLTLTLYEKDLDCSVLFGLGNLTELGLHNGGRYPCPNPTNIAAIKTNHPKLEYVYVSISLSQEDISHILDLPQLKELHIRRQKSSILLTIQHFGKIVNHPRLKFIFLGKALQREWDKFPQTLPNTWKTMKQIVRKPKRSEIVVLTERRKKINVVIIPEEGYLPTNYYQNMRCSSSVVLNQVRMNDEDWTRIREDYQDL